MTSVGSIAERLGFDEQEQESIKIMTSSVFVGAMIGGMFEANNPFEQRRNEKAGAVLGLAAGMSCRFHGKTRYFASCYFKPQAWKNRIFICKNGSNGRRTTSTRRSAKVAKRLAVRKFSC